MKKLLLSGLAISLSLITFGQCNIIYVTPAGTGTGTIVDPSSLTDAATNAVSGDVIKLAIGTYQINNAIDLKDSVTFEGGFDDASAWIKSSTVGLTTIYRSTSNAEGSAGAQRLVAFYGLNKTFFRFQDITISVANGTSPGMSTYGIYLDGCYDYTLARTQILAGNGANGANGSPGAIGLTGGNGSQGGAGSCDGNYSCCFGSESAPGGIGGAGGTGASGTAGGASNATTSANNPGSNGTGRNGGGGGAGGKGGGFSGGNSAVGGSNGGGSASVGVNTSGGNPGGQGDPGGDGGYGIGGANGAVGANGITNPGTYVGGFYVPGNGTNGADGAGGQGGAGGGGGGRQTCATCDDGPGNGGGGGGGGGQGGEKGTAGTGGGSSYCLFLTNNGNGGSLIQCNFVTGNAGNGGTGGTGGNGGTGGTGGASRTTCSSEVGEGRAGGNGGNGGKGGNGGSGASGVSSDVQLLSGTALAISTTNFNLAAQPQVTAENVNCTNTDVNYASVTSLNWSFIPDGTPASVTGSAVASQYASTGRKDVIYGSEFYLGFTNITSDTELSNAGPDQLICDATTANMNAVNPTIGSGMWTSLGTASVTTISDNMSGVTGLVQGDNLFIWTIDGCCGSFKDTVNIVTGSSNTGTDVVSACDSYDWIDGNTYTASNNVATYALTNASGCDSVVTLNLTINTVNVGITQTDDISLLATATGATYQWIDCTNGNAIVPGATNQAFTATVNSDYAVIVTENGCTDTSACMTINKVAIVELDLANFSVYPNPTDEDITINYSGSFPTEMEITDLSGKVVMTKLLKENSEIINLKKLEAGAYFVRLVSNTENYQIRLIKQ